MAKNVKKPVTKKQATNKDAAMKQGKKVTQADARSKALEEATTLAIKLHRRALKELEKH